ncbi:MAG: CCA tRNA nucleotidyltransferase [Clostridia bacterium]|nr:CCA tRNA nucleotidyltransferase [Clostridia bacterium]
MQINLPKNLINLAKKLPKPLYAVGGVVRNFLIDGSIATDIDLAAAITAEEFIPVLKSSGYSVVAEYKRTGTVMFSGDGHRYEFTSFRKEEYESGGAHTPINTEFTEDILEDALRRDFKCNAIYYDIEKGEIVDLLGGQQDIKDRVIDTVTDPEKVFCSDGLRLMRLARFAGELNFKPTYKVITAAKTFADNVKDISPERIFCELNLILQSDGKYPFSDPMGHYNGLKILDETRVLDRIFPELTDGRGMAQRADFHRYDVLEHGLRSVAYAHPKVRLGALLHDIGKPYCFRRDGYYYHHFEEGERIAERVLKRYKASGEIIKQVKFLVKEHMIDLDCSMKELKVRKYIVKNHDRLEELMMVKQADFRASLEIEDTAPALVKWKRIYERMKVDGTPFNLKELEISASDLIEIGYFGEQIGKELKVLLDYAVTHPEKNEFYSLKAVAERDFIRIKH